MLPTEESKRVPILLIIIIIIIIIILSLTVDRDERSSGQLRGVLWSARPDHHSLLVF